MTRIQSNSALRHILLGLVPYTKENLALTFKPNKFFNDLEKLSNKSRYTLRNAYYDAEKQGLIEVDYVGIPRLTNEGRAKIKPYQAKTLPNGAQLMVTFDIPEYDASKRRHLRNLLKELSFVQVQKSVWVSPLDHTDLIKMEIAEYQLNKYVVLYEVSKLSA